MTVREQTQQREEQSLSSKAVLSRRTKGRERPEEEDPIRTPFQRDRDRIIHCKSFRRLMHKTQVFLSPEGDHYRTRLDPYAGGGADCAHHCPSNAGSTRI